jgi:hypothetical protein
MKRGIRLKTSSEIFDEQQIDNGETLTKTLNYIMLKQMKVHKSKMTK